MGTSRGNNMSNKLADINVNVPFDGRRILFKAIFCTAVEAYLLLLLFLQNAPSDKAYQFILHIIAIVVIALFSIYFWTCYIRTQRSILSINSDYISWVNQHRNARVKWSFIREVNIVDLSRTVGRSKHIVYDFVLDARESKLPSPMTLYAKDYRISHPELLELIEQAAKKFNFQVILDRI